MTETKLEIDFQTGCYNHLINDTTCKLIYDKMLEIGAPKFKKEDKEFAKQLQKSFPPNSMEGYYRFIPPDYMELARAVLEQPLNKIVLPEIGKGAVSPGSTDVADVSWVTPLGEFQMACEAIGSPGHSWQNVAQGAMSIGHKGMLHAAKAMALGGLRFMADPDLVQQARDEYDQRIAGNDFLDLLPADAKPDLDKFRV